MVPCCITTCRIRCCGRRSSTLSASHASAACMQTLPMQWRRLPDHALSNAQIAQVLSIAPQTVANQLVSALRELRVMLGPYLDERPVPSLQIIREKDVAAG